MKARWAAAPKEPVTYAGLRFEHRGWNLSLEAGIGAIRLGLEPLGWSWSLRTRVPASRPELEPVG